jgi:hypothetical protein
VLRSIAALAAILGVAAVLGGCGGGGKAASCSLYSHRLKMYVVFRFPERGKPVPPAECSGLGRSFGPAAFRAVKGQSNYAAAKRLCVVHRTGAEADVYVDPHAPHSEVAGRAICKFVKRVLALA